MIIADLTLNRLNEARRRIEGMVHRTPLLHSQTLSARIGAPVWLKCENLQKTGAFKVRGALNRLLTLSDEERARVQSLDQDFVKRNGPDLKIYTVMTFQKVKWKFSVKLN